MNFSDYTGNRRIVDYFQKAVEKDRLAHAYLFSGPGGVGKSTLARLICKTLHCRNPRGTARDFGPCETCSACLKMESGNHSDYHYMIPDGLYFKIDLVRQIIHEASLRPVESSWKTFVLESVDYMRDEAANAFLKVLEEPPGQTVFFLICERPEALLPTIRSRCQRFDFQPLDYEEIANWLVKNKGIEQEQAKAISRYTHGSIGRSLTLNPDQYRETRDKVLIALEASLQPKSYMNLIDAIRMITVERTEMQERLVILEELTRDLLLLQASPDVRVIHEDAKARLLPLVTHIDRFSLQKFYEDLLETREAILKVNANISLALQALLLPLRAFVQDAKGKTA